MIFVSGPHEVRGVELYRGRPIFYSMGACAFELEYIRRFPAEAYESVGLAADASIEEFRSRIGPLAERLRDRRAFEGFVSRITIAEGNLAAFSFCPSTCNSTAMASTAAGRSCASAELGERIIATVATKSKKFGTQIQL